MAPDDQEMTPNDAKKPGRPKLLQDAYPDVDPTTARNEVFFYPFLARTAGLPTEFPTEFLPAEVQKGQTKQQAETFRLIYECIAGWITDGVNNIDYTFDSN